MKTKITAKKGSFACVQRVLSALLALAMLLGLSPQWTIFARAADRTVVYQRKNPEVAILNAYTGQDEGFYKKLLGEEPAYGAYNALTLFKKGDGKTPAYSDSAEDDQWVLNFSDNPVLKGLASPEKNLKVNVSASFYNRIHTHSVGVTFAKTTYSVTGYECINIGIGGELEAVLRGNSDSSVSRPRIGNYTASEDGYETVKPSDLSGSNQSLTLTFYPATPQYSAYTCKCKGTYAENVLVTFRDTRAPQLTNVQYSVDDGSTWTDRNIGLHVGKNQTVKIKLIYDEPIRFANDSADDKGSLYLDLMASGASAGNYEASLTELTNNYMIFSYTVTDENVEIAALSLASLFGSDIPLVQVKGSEHFSIKEEDKTGTGFTTTTCYVTDLAGNALTQKTITSPNLKLDTGTPYVEKVIFHLGLSNSDVKAALGKDQWDVNSDEYTKDYADNSDTYLGVGDTLNVTIQMNEQLKGLTIGTNGANNYVLDTWACVTATTNILDADNNPVELTSLYFTPYKGESGKTSIVMEGITIQSGWKLEGNATEIKVTDVTFLESNSTSWDETYCGTIAENVTDLAGNVLDKDNVWIPEDANASPPRLDTTAPTVAAIENSYETEGTGFRYGVALSDTESQFENINGSFILNNGGDQRAYQYEWAVTAKADTAVTTWNTGVTGTAQTFKQTPSVYLHIRPKSSESYVNLSRCTITVKAKDYAGNESNTTLPGGSDVLAWYIDNLAPSVRAGETTCKIENGTGKLTAKITLSDGNGISAWQYAWSDSDTTAPTAWTNGAVTVTAATSVNVTVTGTVAIGNLFSQYLWVKATDSSTNQNVSAPLCLGKYTYDLRKTQFTLNYSSDYKVSAGLTISDRASDGALLIMIPAGTDGHYAVFNFGTSYNQDLDVLSSSVKNRWAYYQVTKNADDTYTFTKEDTNGAADIVDRMTKITYSGDLRVTVLSGPSSALTTDSSGAITAAGNSTYPFAEDVIQLKVAGQGSYGDITLSCEDKDKLGMEASSATWTTSNGYHLTTLAGLRFTVSIGGDNNGWNYGDVDWQKSYILFTSGDSSPASYKVPLGPFQISDGKASQTVTVPEREGGYASGVYTAVLHLNFHSGAAEKEAQFRKTVGANTETLAHITVDAKEPNSEFGLTSVVYDRKSSDYGISTTAYGDTMKWVCFANGETASDVIYIPANGAACTVTVESPAEEPWETHAVSGVIVNGQPHKGTTGQYSVKIWNLAAPDDYVELTPSDNKTVTGTIKFYKDKNYAAEKSDVLYLEPDVRSTIAVQKVYQNGRKSDIKYYSASLIDTSENVSGTVTLDNANEQVVFTPNNSALANAATDIYAWVWQNGEDKSAGERIDMTLQSDGTWRCAMEPEGRYMVMAVSEHGSVTTAGYIAQRSPWFTDTPASAVYQRDKQSEGLTVTDNGNGTYTLRLCVRDDYDEFFSEQLQVTVSFNDDYSDQTFTITTGKAWTASDVSPSGIYAFAGGDVGSAGIQGGKNSIDCRSYRNLTLQGYYANVSGTTMDVTVAVTDSSGRTGTVTSAGNTVNYQAPTVTGSEFTDEGLKLTFSQPVRPVESWAWHETDNTGYSTEWTGAFPISGNGTWTIEFLDIFGNECQTEVTVDAFTVGGTDYSIDLDFSTTELTGDPITMTASAANGGLLVYWKSGDGSSMNFLDSIKSWDTSTGDYGGDASIAAQSRVTEITDSGRYFVQLLNTGGFEILNLRIYVDNVAGSAPSATVYYYVEELGQEFTDTGLTQYIKSAGGSLTVTGNVTARYTTSRHVTPTGDNAASEFVFKPGDAASHTFNYVDDYGHEGSVTASLPNGLTLKEYEIPPEDKQAPVVDVEVYAKRGDVYSLEAAFLGTDNKDAIQKTLTDLSYVQGYSLVLKVSDASGYTIALTKEDGTVPPETDAALAGNVITVTKAGTYHVTVTDTSENANETKIIIPVPALLDNEKPTAKIDVTAESLYEQTITVTLGDTDDTGDPTTLRGADGNPTSGDTVTLELPVDSVKTGVNTYQYTVTANESVTFRFRDIAGNTGTATQNISGIDTDPPKLTVRWSPSDSKDAAYPTTRPVNTNITAHIESDKAMYDVAVQAGNESVSHDLLVNGKAQDYTIPDPNDLTSPLVTFVATPERITVTYAGNYDQTLTFTATAPNGKSTELTIGFTGLIDRTAPTVTDEQTELKRSGCSTPYAVKVTLTPDEDAVCAGYASSDYYNAKNPLTVTYTENGTYRFRFSDKAGNIETKTVTIATIDNTAPDLQLEASTEVGQTATVTVTVDEACTVTWGDGATHEFTTDRSYDATITNNGTYAFTATDNAGNTRARMIVVGTVDNVAPTISFTSGTIYVKSEITEKDLNAKLREGFSYSDNKTAHDTLTAKVQVQNLGGTSGNYTAGQYTVAYTVTDGSGNTATATRILRIIGKDTVCLTVDGDLVIPGSTAVIKSGAHTLALENNGTEPYTVKARKGVLGEGQMKYLSGSSLRFDEKGNFTVTGTGYYTLLVTTQSRQTIRILLYIEQ